MTVDVPECPVCASETAAGGEFAPFCTARCKWVDLGRWLDGHYALPGEEAIDFQDVLDYEERKARGGGDNTDG